MLFLCLFSQVFALLKNEWVNKQNDFYDLSFPATAWNPDK